MVYSNKENKQASLEDKDGVALYNSDIQNAERFESSHNVSISKLSITLVILWTILFFILGVLISTIYWTHISNSKYSILSSAKVRDTLSQYYGDESIDTEELENIYTKSVVDAIGDKYTFYLYGDQAEEMDESVQGKINGIGIIAVPNDNGILVARVMSSSPAEASGLQAGDIIRTIDGIGITSLGYRPAIEKIQGEPGSVVKLGVSRGDEEREVSVKRAIINAENAYYKDAGRYGYIRIEAFSGNVTDQFENCLESTKDKEGLIIDLRGNTGGDIDLAEEIGDLLMDKCTMITLKKNKGRDTKVKLKDGVRYGKPITVLVNESTASASEILAGSLRDNNGALLIGTTTYGKGVICSYNKYDDGTVICVTSGEYILPKGESINGVGLEPDIEIEFENSTNKNFYMLSVEEDNQIKMAMDTMDKIQETSE